MTTLATAERRPVANRSGTNGPDGPCEDVFQCECIGAVRDPESGAPTHLLFENPNGGPPTACPLNKEGGDGPTTLVLDPENPPKGVTFADPDNPTAEELEAMLLALASGAEPGTIIVFGELPNQWVWYVDGDGTVTPIRCPPDPTEVIDPANPPTGVVFADPDNPTPDELAAAAATLLDGAPAGSKAKFGDEPCQWIYEVDSAGDVCLLSKPWLQKTAQIYFGNTGIDILPTHDENTDFFPIGCMSFELPCAQEVVFEGYGHFRTDLEDIVGGSSQSFTMIIIDGGTPASMGHVTIHERDAAGERQVPYLYTTFLDAGTHTVCFEERLNYSTTPFSSNHKIDYNQFKIVAKWVE